MKQTNNAIKFLMAQYRAICKNAYFKGLSSALLITAGLAATQAQADGPYYTSDDQTWNTTSGSSDTRVAGNIAGIHRTTSKEGTSVSGGDWTIDFSFSGSKGVYGGFVDATKVANKDVDVSAFENHLTIDEGKASIGDGSNHPNLVGGWAKTQNGLASSRNNSVELILPDTATTASHAIESGNQVIGGWASSLNGAVSQSNTVTLHGSNDTARVLLGNGAFGGQAFVDANATGGDYVAQGNKLDVQYITASGTGNSSLWLIGGYAYTNGTAHSGTGTVDSLQAIGNAVIADHIKHSTDSATNTGLIVGNLAVNNLNNSVTDVIANGNGKDTTVAITNSTIYHSTIFGGQATNYSGGSATANANIVSIKDTNVLDTSTPSGNAVYGGYAEITAPATGDKNILEASNNVVTIELSTKDSGVTKSFVGNVLGAQVQLTKGSSSANDFVGSSLTANNNSVTIGEGITVSSGSIYGAFIGTDGANVASGGATITASNNTVTINGDVSADTTHTTDVIAGAMAEKGIATLTNNKVVINGKVSGVDFIYGALASPQSDIAGKVEKPQINLNDNSIVIGANADVSKTTIIAAIYNNDLNTNNASTFNNNVTIEGKVTNSDIYGGAGAKSAITLASGGSLTYNHDTPTDNGLRSDIVNLAGTVNVGANDTLQITGFLTNGRVKTNPSGGVNTFNTNQTNIANSANLFNRGEVELFGDTTVENGAKLHALTAGATIKVNSDWAGSVIHDTIGTDDIDFEMVGGRGALHISSADLNSYLSAGDEYTQGNITSTDKAGTVKITNKGVLDFTDSSVILSDFDYTNNDKDPGKIQVGNTGTDFSILRGDNLTVAHKFATNGSTAQKYTDLATAGFTPDYIQIEANTLNLGSSTLSSTQSEAIRFDKATVKNEINFIAQTSGDDRNDPTDTVITNQKNNGYHLTSKVIGDNYMVTNDQESNLAYYTALDGDINGPVIITNANTNSGSLTIRNGNWTAHDLITMDDSGSLTIGGDSEIDPDPSVTTRQSKDPNAILVAEQGLVLNVDTLTTDDSTITVEGAYDKLSDLQTAVENDAATEGDIGLAVLDLRKGLSMQGLTTGSTTAYNGKATITATSGGVVLLKASDVNEILAQNDQVDAADRTSKGAFFLANNAGVFVVEGNLEADFNDFGNGSTNGFGLSSGATPDKNGFLITDKATIINPSESTNAVDDATYIANASTKKLNLVGTLITDDLTISDLQLTNGAKKPSGAGSYASQVTMANGRAIVSKSFTTNNQTLVLGDTNGAYLEFESDLVSDKGSINAANIKVVNGSINIANGQWQASDTNFTLSGANSVMNIGDGGEDDSGENYFANLDAASITMAKDTLLRVNANGTASFDRADFGGLTTYTTTTDASGKTVPATGVYVAGSLYINGDSAATIVSGGNTVDDPANGVKFGAAGSIHIANNGDLYFGNAALAAIIDETATFNSGEKADQEAAVSGAMAKGFTAIGNDGGILHLDFADNVVFGGDAIKYLKTKLFTSGSLSDGVLVKGGILNIGDASFNGIKVDPLTGEGLSGYTATWEDLKGFSDIFGNDVTNNELSQTNVSQIHAGDQVQGNWGSLSMATDAAASAKVEIAGHTRLNFAEGNNGYFISNASHSAALGANVQSQKSLTLVNGGTIGDIVLQNGLDDAEKNLTTLRVTSENADSLTTIASIDGAIGSSATGDPLYTRVDIGSNTNVTGDITDIGEIYVKDGALLNVANAEVLDDLDIENASMVVKGTLTLDNADGAVTNGSLSAKDIVLNNTRSAGSDLLIANQGITTAQTLSVTGADATANQILVGVDTDWATETLPEGFVGTGYLEISNYLDLNGATLITDPNYGEATSVSAIAHFRNGKDSDFAGVNNAGIINGKIWVGANAATGIGASLEETKNAIASFQEGGSLKADKYGSILYLNGHVTLTNGSEIALNASDSLKEEREIRNSLLYTVTNNKLDQYADLGLGDHTAIIMSEKAFADDKGDKTNTAIYFDRKAAVVNGNGGDILLTGTFNAAEKLNFFNDQDNNGVDVKGMIEVYTENGFLYTTLQGDNQGYGVELHVDKDAARNIMYEASNPVLTSLIDYHEKRLASYNENQANRAITEPTEQAIEEEDADLLAANSTQGRSGPIVDTGSGSGTGSGSDPADPTDPTDPTNPTDPTTPPSSGNTPAPETPVASTRVTGNSAFLNEVINTSHGAPAEAAARLAIYGGAVQAALAANQASSEAIAARMGMGANKGITVANNGQGGSLWVSPFYKSVDSDGFAAEGLNYGVDLSLYGLALGADFTFMPGLTAGIMFNVGSGDADGQGNSAANNTSNDFDYWGAAIYGNYQLDALSITADLTYTAVDNDVEAATGMKQYSKLEGSMDSSALSLGVTAQYTLNVEGIDVVPHAGMRFTHVDLDDYSIKSNGEEVAHYDADSLDVFSIPVGVTFTKEFVTDGWAVKPSFDLTLTANMGDDEISGDVTWEGVKNLSTKVSSEILDNFTYGATLGISAQSGNFSLGAGVNYTGSSNTDEFGINANARFVF